VAQVFRPVEVSCGFCQDAASIITETRGKKFACETRRPFRPLHAERVEIIVKWLEGMVRIGSLVIATMISTPQI
jgi:hypothetical protein